jgi:tRNA A37 threonylcarbamoyladenosine dehydratase
MKKLSKIELDVVVSEVVNGIRLIEKNKSEELFNKSENKDLFLNKVSEIEELENKVSKLKEEIREIENKFKEDNLRVFFNSNNNRNYGNVNKSFIISLIDGNGNSYSLYKDIEKEIVLNGISSEFDIKKFIEELVEKFK